MRHPMIAVPFVCALALSAAACGGNAEDPRTASSKASLELAPMDELKAIPRDLEAEVTGLTKPIDDVQSVLDDLAKLPEKHGLKATDIASMAKATFDSGKVSVTLDADVGAEARADVEASLTKLAEAVTALKSTPDRVAALTKKTAAATARVPILASKITASATATVSNPFGDAAGKAKAQADLDGVKQVQADVMKSVSEVQTKIVELPRLATNALAKLSASFSGAT